MNNSMKETQQKINLDLRSHVIVIGLIIIIVWSVIITGFFLWDRHNKSEQNHKLLLNQARISVQQLLTSRHWIAIQGGIYVPVSKTLQPNPYLPLSGRDVVTTDGLKLTKVNPAYFTRQIAELDTDKNSINFHLTSARPLRPANKPTPWETEALRQFTPDHTEVYDQDISATGEPIFRYMAPLYVQKPCLQCHAAQGYKEGELRGGISLTINLASIIQAQTQYFQKIDVTYLALWLVGIIGIIYCFHRLHQSDRQQLELINKLQNALNEVKALSGLLPICSSCKKIRDDKGYWQQIEVFISKHSEAQFSHGICLDCAKRIYPDLYGDVINENDIM